MSGASGTPSIQEDLTLIRDALGIDYGLVADADVRQAFERIVRDRVDLERVVADQIEIIARLAT